MIRQPIVWRTAGVPPTPDGESAGQMPTWRQKMCSALTPRPVVVPEQKRHSWRRVHGDLVEYRSMVAIWRSHRHARQRPAGLPHLAVARAPLARPSRPPPATGVRRVLVGHLSYALLARPVSLR